MKKVLLAVSLTFVACVFPAAASANWIHNGVEIGPGDPSHLTLEGAAAFVDPIFGGVHCEEEAYATITLTPNSNHGRVEEYGNTNPAIDCEVQGLLGSICGERSLREVYIEGEPTLTATPEVGSGRTIDITGVTLVIVFGPTPEPCLVLHLTGSLTATADNQAAFSSVDISGSLETSLESMVEVSRSLNADVPGTFGNDGIGE